jgi:hypothetical protein
MGDAKSPAAKIAARFFADEMLEQREKHLLHDFFAVLDAQSGREQITEKPVAPSIEQECDFFFEAPGVGGTSTGLSRVGDS